MLHLIKVDFTFKGDLALHCFIWSADGTRALSAEDAQKKKKKQKGIITKERGSDFPVLEAAFITRNKKMPG